MNTVCGAVVNRKCQRDSFMHRCQYVREVFTRFTANLRVHVFLVFKLLHSMSRMVLVSNRQSDDLVSGYLIPFC